MGGSCKEYADRGFSGKNTDRPKFQELIGDIKSGLVKRVVVYKLDRISRSILDFANMMELFQQYGVEFISSTEKFDTSTPMGRAMLNICIVFAQLERETIQKRVADACHSRSLKGYRLGGPVPYGFHTEPIVMNGVRTKRFVANAGCADIIRMMYDMYAKPSVSLRDVMLHLAGLNIRVCKGEFQRKTITKILCSPNYVQADLDVYKFYKSKGVNVVNDALEFTGVNGCYLYQGQDKKKRGYSDLAGLTLVLAPHEGMVPSGVWLKCRRKLMKNKDFRSAHKVVNTWLAGKIKCGRCGYALKAMNQYLRCAKRAADKSCEGGGNVKKTDMEALVYREMVHKLRDFHTLSSREESKSNPKATALKVELAQVEAEIEKLLESLTGASDILISYANAKIADMDSRRQSLIKQLADIASAEVPSERMLKLSELLDSWEEIGLEEKREVLDSLIVQIKATKETVDIKWRF
jgi:DNA invertase Pin-like site-specific DNA recombinase